MPHEGHTLTASPSLISVLLLSGLFVLSTAVSGDVNKDEAVNNKDVVVLFRYASGSDVAVNVAALDVNGDGSVNNKDVVVLFRYVSGADITLSDKPYVPGQ